MSNHEFSLALLTKTLGPNLTSTFGLEQLPKTLKADTPYETLSGNNQLIVTSVRGNRLSFADGYDRNDRRYQDKPKSNAIFAIESPFSHRAKYALYTHRDGKPHNPDFEHNAAEFMVKAHQYLLKVLAIPLTTIVADWFSDEAEFDRFRRVYDPMKHNLVEAVRSTWSAPIIMDQLKYRYVSANPEALQSLHNQRVIEVEFSNTVQY